MLLTFRTDAGDITMFKNDALTMLKMMEHSATIPVAILAADVPAALSQLKTAVDKEKASFSNENTEPETEEPSVSMAHRALPLYDLLTTAAKKSSNVMWK